MRLDPIHCWLCGMGSRPDRAPLRADRRRTPLQLCAPCWDRQPPTLAVRSRGGAALAALLDLPAHQWHTSSWAAMTQTVAARHGIRAWADTPARTAAPTEPWGWIGPHQRTSATQQLAALVAAVR